MRNMSIKRAAGIQFISKYLNVVIQLILMAILARLITPEEFGLVAIITVFLNLSLILSELGIGPAIVQFNNLERKDYSGLFTLSVVIGLVLSGLLCLFSSVISSFYEDSALIGLCCWSAISVVFNALNMVPNGLLLKQKRFDLIGLRLIVSSLLSGGIAVLLAYWNFGSYAMVWNFNLTAFFVFVFNIITCRNSFSLSFCSIVPAVKKVLRYSGFQAGWGLVNFFSRNLDSLLIGKLLGSSSLGYYDKAYKLITYPINYLPGIFSSVLQPYLSEYQNKLNIIYDNYLKIQKLVSLIAIPITIFLVICSSEIIMIMYGNQWGSSAPLLSALGFSVYFQMLNTLATPILQSCGRTDYLFRHICIATATTVGMLCVGLLIGDLFLVSVLISASYCFHSIPIIYYCIIRTFKCSVYSYLKNFVFDFAFIVVSIAFLHFVFAVLHLPLFIAFVAKTVSIVLLWAGYLFISGQICTFLRLVK